MLAATLPYVHAWNAWYADTGNAPAGVPALREVVDAAAREAGRDPASIERTVAVQVRMPGGTGRVMGDTNPRMTVPPLEGDAAHMAEELRAYAREGDRARAARGGPDHRGLGRRAGPGAGAARQGLRQDPETRAASGAPGLPTARTAC